MVLKDTIQADMKAALLGGDRFASDVLRGLKAAVLNEEVTQGKRDEGLSDDEIEKVIAREVKKRHESSKLYRDNGRDDLAEPEEKEAAILSKYLPQHLSEDEVRVLVQKTIADMDVVSIQAMGQVIGNVKKATGLTADGAVIARIVKEELQ